MAKDYFCCYHSTIEALEPLTDAEKGRLWVACLEYSKSATVQELRGNERFVFPSLKAQIDSDKEAEAKRSETQRQNVMKRWNTTVYDGKSGIPTDTTVYDGKIGKIREKEKEEPPFPLPPHTPLSLNPQEEKERERARAGKKKYGEFENVALTDEERQKLEMSMGDIGVSEYIERLSGYIAQNGKRYKSHYAAILNWWRRDGAPVKRSPPKWEMKPDDVRDISGLSTEELFG